jgi:hypothetical protein
MKVPAKEREGRCCLLEVQTPVSRDDSRRGIQGKYTGKAMTEAHVHLNISEKEWGVMAKEFKKSLDKIQGPGG